MENAQQRGPWHAENTENISAYSTELHFFPALQTVFSK